MSRYLLDTSALLTLRDNESGADRVAEILAMAQRGEARVMGCFVSLMEVSSRVWKDEGEAEGRLAYAQCLSLPVEWVHESRELLEQAAAIKAQYPLSLADAWIAACARLRGAQLVHKDPELQGLPVAQVALPA
jgi:predicted nucleic acid-binding protein